MRLPGLIALLLASCTPEPAPACADGQQNACRCGELSGTQTCGAGKYSECDCAAAEKQVVDAKARVEAEKKAADEAREKAEAEEKAAANDYERERAKLAAEKAALEEQLRTGERSSDGKIQLGDGEDPLSGI